MSTFMNTIEETIKFLYISRLYYLETSLYKKVNTSYILFYFLQKTYPSISFKKHLFIINTSYIYSYLLSFTKKSNMIYKHVK